MARAVHKYSVAKWEEMVNSSEHSISKIASHCGVSRETIANILSGKTPTARRDTKVKIQNGLKKLGVEEEIIESLFLKN